MKRLVNLLHKDLSYKIQGIAFSIRKDFGLGDKEQIYQKAFEEELKRSNIPYAREKAIKIFSPKDGKFIGLYRPDFIIDDKIILEIKTYPLVPKHEMRKIYDYLRNSSYELGYLMNFGSSRLYIKRIIFTNNKKSWFKKIHLNSANHKLTNAKSNPLVFFSILLAFVSGLFSGLLPSLVNGAMLYLMPQSQSVYQGDSFVVEIKLDTEGKEVNAVEIILKFPLDLLEVVDISRGGSILTLWVSEPFSQSSGFLKFIGGIPKGFKGEGLIGKIIFQGKKRGEAVVNFEENSQVLLADGKGTSAKLTFLEGNYKIIERPEKLPLIFSRSHPDQNKWYKSNTLHLRWDLIEGAEYSFILSKDPLAEPDEIPDKPGGELIWMGDMEYPNLEDGIYYFSLKQKLPSENWSKSVTFRAMIDATPPEEFKIEISQDPAIFDGKHFLSFATTDKTSGIDYYEIKEGKRDFKKGTSPYLLEEKLGEKIVVRAYDKAGNWREAELTLPYKLTLRDVLAIILVLIAIGGIWWIIKYQKSNIKNKK